MSPDMEEGVTYQTEVYENITMFSTEQAMTTSPIIIPDHGSSSDGFITIIFMIAFYVIIFSLAVIGNSLVIVTLIQNKRMRSVTNVFLFSLSVSDLLFVCVCLPFTLVGNLLHSFIFGPVMCRLISYTMGKYFSAIESNGGP